MVARPPPCVILAGGRSSRMGGGDKSLMSLNGEPLLGHVVRAVAPQTGAILINAQGDASRFAAFGLPVRADAMSGYLGPLAGLLTGMEWAREKYPGASQILSVSCDTPFLPHDLVTRLAAAFQYPGSQIAIARDPQRVHPTIGLWPVALAARLRADLEQGCRAIYRWLANFQTAEQCFAVEYFRNFNTPQDLCTMQAAPDDDTVGRRNGGPDPFYMGHLRAGA